jgi:hypothetical protein
MSEMLDMRLEATPLRDNRWAVKPAGRLGTHGWIMHYGAITPWHVVYVNARTESAAIKKATQQLRKEGQ